MSLDELWAEQAAWFRNTPTGDKLTKFYGPTFPTQLTGKTETETRSALYRIEYNRAREAYLKRHGRSFEAETGRPMKRRDVTRMFPKAEGYFEAVRSIARKIALSPEFLEARDRAAEAVESGVDRTIHHTHMRLQRMPLKKDRYESEAREIILREAARKYFPEKATRETKAKFTQWRPNKDAAPRPAVYVFRVTPKGQLRILTWRLIP